MSLRQLNRVILSIFLIAAVSSDARGAFDIETSGSVYPSHAADGDWRVASTSTGEDSAMYVGLSSGGAVDVTNGATFTTPKRVWMGYSYGATTAINVTGAAWIAEDHVGLGNATAAEATINITQSTWTVDDSCYIGASTNATGEVNLYNQAVWTSKDYVHVGHHGVGEVNIDPNASWISQEAVNVGFFADSSGTVTLDGGDWTSQARLEVGHLALFGEFSEGAVNVNADSTLTCNGLLDVTPGGEVILDGGLLHLGGGGTFDGALSAAVGGGTVRLEVGSAEPDIDLCSLGSGVNFAGCTLEVVFDPAFTPSTSDSFNLFDPIDSVDLTEILTASSAISTPEN
jgi:T5SS/PEP-CTERM-associated repeat protein